MAGWWSPDLVRNAAMTQDLRWRGLICLPTTTVAPNAQPRGPASGHGEKDWIGSEAEGQLSAFRPKHCRDRFRINRSDLPGLYSSERLACGRADRSVPTCGACTEQ